MNTIIERPRWFFYPLWIILTSLSVPAAFIIDLSILKIITGFIGDFIYVNGVSHITEDYLYMYFFIPLIGMITGGIQYGLLRRYLPRIGWWVVATLGGWLLGVLLIALLRLISWSDGSNNLDMAFILIGLAIGIGQWLLLRPHFHWPSLWIGANVLGWGVLALLTPGDTLNQFALLTLGFIPACFTALALALFMLQAKPIQPKDSLLPGVNLFA